MATVFTESVSLQLPEIYSYCELLVSNTQHCTTHWLLVANIDILESRKLWRSAQSSDSSFWTDPIEEYSHLSIHKLQKSVSYCRSLVVWPSQVKSLQKWRLDSTQEIAAKKNSPASAPVTLKGKLVNWGPPWPANWAPGRQRWFDVWKHKIQVSGD